MEHLLISGRIADMYMYELYNNGKLDGIYTSDVIAKRLNLSKQWLYECVRNQKLISGIWLIKQSRLTYEEAQKINTKIPKEIIRKNPKKIVVKKHKNSAGRTFCLPIYNEEEKIINA